MKPPKELRTNPYSDWVWDQWEVVESLLAEAGAGYKKTRAK